MQGFEFKILKYMKNGANYLIIAMKE